MSNEMDPHNILPPVISKISPTEFDVTIHSLLIGLGADKYVEKFSKHNIGQYTLMELTDEDLIKFGVDDADIRKKVIEAARSIPLSEETQVSKPNCSGNLSPMEIVDVLDETSQHLYKIYLSVLANTIALKKTTKIPDSLLHRDQYASDIALATLSEITNILNSMDITLHTQLKVLKPESEKNKKLIVGTVGSAVIVTLSLLFIRSITQLK